MTKPSLALLLLPTLAVLWFAAAPAQPPAGRRPAASGPPAVATVGSLRITRPEFDARVREAEAQYAQQGGTPLAAQLRPLFRRQILETMMRENLLRLEVSRRGLGLSDAQAEEELKRDAFFQRNGIFDEAKFLAIKSTQPEQFRKAIAQIQRDLPPMRLKEEVDRLTRPDEGQLKQMVERERSSATVSSFHLPRSWFTEGGPEPTEAMVLAEYRDHPDAYRRPESADLEMILVNQPALPASADETAARAWETGMQARADSLLRTLRAGGDVAASAAPFGGPRRATVTRGAFPKYWKGVARSRELPFSTREGDWLPEVVRGEGGWLLARVVDRMPEGVAPLAEVAAEIRATLRLRLAAERDRRDTQALYAALRDSLRGTGYYLRYAVADTGTFRVPEPRAADLDRYYRGHQADYAHFDARTSSVIVRPLAEVREDVRRRMLGERRQAAARRAAEDLLRAWTENRREAAVEREMALLREVGPLRAGATVDTGAAGTTLTDSLSLRMARGTGLLPTARGWLVFHVHREIPDYVPTAEQIGPWLAARLAGQRAAEEEAQARRFFAANPQRFAAGRVVRFSRLLLEPPDPLQVPLSAEEVRTWYNGHIEKYSAQQLARVRHILVAPRDSTPAADREARAEADHVLEQLRAGASFASLVERHSDDEGTRHSGGDVGVFRRGMMLDEFERVAFTMAVGEIRGPVRTEVGYHILECLEQTPAEIVPLKYAWANAGSDAVRDKGLRIARFRADSLLRVFRTPAQARRAARANNWILYENDHVPGTPMFVPELKAFFAALDTLPPGRFYPRVVEYHGQGFVVAWVDTVLSGQPASWEQARDEAIAARRRELERAALLAKRAEFDSLETAGWSVDSVAALLGGFQSVGSRSPGEGLGRPGTAAPLDSLAFGDARRPPALAGGGTSGWIETPTGLMRVRLVERRAPDPVQLAGAIESRRRIETERNLREYFDRLRKRFPTRILDSDLAFLELPSLDAE